MLIEMFFEEIWPCIQETTDHLAAERITQSSERIRAGLNFSIILGSACFLEGIFESFLRAILECRGLEFRRAKIEGCETRRAVNAYYNRLEEDLSDRIGQSVGAGGYSEAFGLIFGEPLNKLKEIVPLWEGVTVLFNFRNVLGHGRRVFAQRLGRYGSYEGTEDFTGSYKVVENYLIKLKLMQWRFIDAHSEYIFLSDAIADHFWQLAKRVPPALLSSLPDLERDACRKTMDR